MSGKLTNSTKDNKTRKSQNSWNNRIKKWYSTITHRKTKRTVPRYLITFVPYVFLLFCVTSTCIAIAGLFWRSNTSAGPQYGPESVAVSDLQGKDKTTGTISGTKKKIGADSGGKKKKDTNYTVSNEKDTTNTVINENSAANNTADEKNATDITTSEQPPVDTATDETAQPNEAPREQTGTDTATGGEIPTNTAAGETGQPDTVSEGQNGTDTTTGEENPANTVTDEAGQPNTPSEGENATLPPAESDTPSTAEPEAQPEPAVEESKKLMYLTFDDGPSVYTPVVLDTLREHNAKATFFVVGRNVSAYPEYARRIVDEGHTIGIHCNVHEYKGLYSSVDSYLHDFDKAYQTVIEVTGVEPQLFRFPGGSINSFNKNTYADIIAKMEERGFIYFDWNASVEDATGKKATPEQLVENAVNTSAGKKRVVMLCHDIVKNTSLCLDDLLNQFQDEYAFLPLTPDVKPIQFPRK